MLYERPNVRVHNDPAILCLSREAAGHDLTGRTFLGVPILWASKERVQNIFLNTSAFISLLTPKKRTKEKVPSSLA